MFKYQCSSDQSIKGWDGFKNKGSIQDDQVQELKIKDRYHLVTQLLLNNIGSMCCICITTLKHVFEMF